MNVLVSVETQVDGRSVPTRTRAIRRTANSRLLECAVCKTVVKVVEQHGFGLVCCGRDMIPSRNARFA